MGSCFGETCAALIQLDRIHGLDTYIALTSSSPRQPCAMIGTSSARPSWEIQRRRSGFSKRTHPGSIGRFLPSCEIEKMPKMQFKRVGVELTRILILLRAELPFPPG